jgi:hypothetical protein
MTGEDFTAVTTVRHDWSGEEQALPGVWAELKRLGRRARRRWLRTLGYTLVCSALAVGFVARKPRVYSSRVVFAVHESALEAATPLRTDGKLREYVATVVFSHSRLLSVLREHQLYPSLLARDPDLAVEAMRDDLDVEVWRTDRQQPRLAVAFRGRDAQEVFDTVTHLGQLIGDSEQRIRRQQAEAALRAADAEVESTGTLVTAQKRELLDKQMASERARTPDEGLRLVLEQRKLEKQLARQEELLRQLEKRREQAWLRTRPEQQALALRWQLIDPGHIEPDGLSRRALLTWLGAIAFLLALPLCCIGVGAFDPHVYDLDDVRRLGMATVGAVRRFEGDNAGALVSRLASDDAGRSAPGGDRARMTPS